jgi:hypothetical protein
MRRRRCLAVFTLALVSASTHAAAPASPAVKLFPDAPPPPSVIGLPDFCCTAAGRFAFVNPGADGVKRQQGEACVAPTDDGKAVSGKACF